MGVVPITVVIFFLPASIGRSSSELKTLKWWQVAKRLDPIGTVLLLGSIICLLLAVQWGGAQYPWSSGRVIALFVIFGVTFIAWIMLQYLEVSLKGLKRRLPEIPKTDTLRSRRVMKQQFRSV